jgi:hypothetical protein
MKFIPVSICSRGIGFHLLNHAQRREPNATGTVIFLQPNNQERSLTMTKPDAQRNVPPKTDEELKKLKEAVNNLDKPAQPRAEPPLTVPAKNKVEKG